MIFLNMVFQEFIFHNVTFLDAVLITGGGSRKFGVRLYSAELFLPSAGTSCTLPLFPMERYMHSVENNIICGGDWTRDTCLIWSSDSGSWEELSSLWTLIDISTSPGHWACHGYLLLTSWKVRTVRRQLPWSKMMEPKSQPSGFNIVHR